MKILDWTLEVQCHKCGSKLLLEERDILRVPMENPHGKAGIMYTYFCPCGQVGYISEKDAPHKK